jgi:hypothetical protein
MSRTLRRLAVVLIVCVASLLGTTVVANAAPAPKLTPKQQQALCIAKESIALLKAIDKQTWKDPKARDAAIKAIPVKAKAACPVGGTSPQPTTYTVSKTITTPAGTDSAVTVTCNSGDTYVTDSLRATDNPSAFDGYHFPPVLPDGSGVQTGVANSNSPPPEGVTVTTTFTITCQKAKT